MASESADFCEREHDVLAALGSGPLPVQLTKHLTSCAVCAKAMEMARQLWELAESGMDDPLPSADFIMWKSALLYRQKVGRSNDLVLRWSAWSAIAVLLSTIGLIAPAIVHDLSGFGNTFFIGLGTLAGILAVSGVALCVWQRVDR